MSLPTPDAIQQLLDRGEPGAAVAAATALLDVRPAVDARQHAAALWLRAHAHERCGDIGAGIADLRALGAMTPANARVFSELGVLLTQGGEMRLAAEAFARAVQLDPAHARTWNNFGNALSAIGERDAAVRAFERAIQVDPGYALAHANLGNLLNDLGRWQEAERVLAHALELDGNVVAALVALASIQVEKGAVDAAISLYQRATRLLPRDARMWMHLARAHAEMDDIAAARAAFGHAASLDPGLLRAHLGQHLSLANVYTSAADLAHARAGFDAGLATLERTLPAVAATLSAERRVNGPRWSNFLLGYQGLDDRALQQRYGALLAQVMGPAAPPPRPAGRTRIRIGFVSSFFRDSTIGRYFQSWITGLDRARFEVIVYHLNNLQDNVAATLQGAAEHFRNCPRWMPVAVEKIIRADAPDILVYPELGMDATTFTLGALRLAPLQCAGWGHPVTTGLPSIDIFLSSGAMEIAAAQAHYSEELVRLPGIGTRYAMPVLQPGGTRAQYGLPAHGPLLLCPQSPFKIQPDDDLLLARVMAGLPAATLVLFKGRNEAINARLRRRLDAALAEAGVDAATRIFTLPAQRHADYLRINALCSVMLDTTRWSGGNTALDAIAASLPIVTMPGTLMRSRQTAGMYALMDIADLTVATPDDYVATVRRLAEDNTARQAAAARISERRHRIFDDPEPLRAFSAVLQARAP